MNNCHVVFMIIMCQSYLTLANIKVVEKTRLFITYVRQAAEGPYPQKAFYCKLAELVGTERDIDWERGHSRRYLRIAEGFNCSLHNTTVYASKPVLHILVTSMGNYVGHDIVKMMITK